MGVDVHKKDENDPGKVETMVNGGDGVKGINTSSDIKVIESDDQVNNFNSIIINFLLSKVRKLSYLQRNHSTMENDNVNEVKEVKTRDPKEYYLTQCYNKSQFKNAVEVEGVFGEKARIIKVQWVDGSKRLKVTIQFPNGDEKVFPIKAEVYEGSTYLNKRSVAFFRDRTVKKVPVDLDDFISEPLENLDVN